MLNKFLFLFLPSAILACGTVSGQTFDKAYFKKHLSTSVYKIDTEASAVILFDRKHIEFSVENYRYIQTESIHRIVKILKADALAGPENEANVHVRFYSSSDRNYLYKLKGATYNLVNNTVVTTDIGKTDVYEKNINKAYDEVSFSFPGAKVGSIIEYSYDLITAVDGELPRWNIQEEYPKLLTEYSVICPERWQYTSLSHVRPAKKKCASLDLALKDSCTYCEVDFANDMNSYSTLYRKDVQAIKEEPYVTTLKNYMENVEFQFTGARNAQSINFLNTWDDVNKFLYGRFADMQNTDNNDLIAVADSITKRDTSLAGKTRNIYNYVRNNYTYVADKRDVGKAKDLLAKLFKDKKGNVEQLNSLVLYLLFQAHVPTYPIFLSTVGELSPSPAFPINRFNYVACAVVKDSSYVYLDASDKNNCYGFLPGYCYNGYARIIDSVGEGVELTSDMIKDKTVVGITISEITDSDAKIEIMKKNGLITSSQLRKKWAKDDTDKQAYIDKFIQALPGNLEIKESSLNNVDNPDTNLVEKYVGIFSFKKGASTIFLNSTLIKLFDKNPFTAPTRNLPVDFSHKTDYQCFMNITLPANMEAVDIPQPSIIDFENQSMMHKKIYNYNPASHILTVSSSFIISGTKYGVSEYDQMKDFFLKTIQSDNEMITLKKTNAQ